MIAAIVCLIITLPLAAVLTHDVFFGYGYGGIAIAALCAWVAVGCEVAGIIQAL